MIINRNCLQPRRLLIAACAYGMCVLFPLLAAAEPAIEPSLTFVSVGGNNRNDNGSVRLRGTIHDNSAGTLADDLFGGFVVTIDDGYKFHVSIPFSHCSSGVSDRFRCTSSAFRRARARFTPSDTSVKFAIYVAGLTDAQTGPALSINALKSPLNVMIDVGGVPRPYSVNSCRSIGLRQMVCH